ncbi:MAG: cysteine desulfurase [Lachnospiraceae bacterium]|nr:cysteine desulfurase [Lachnospiraceae bacterium]
MEIYLDNSATTKVDDNVIELIEKVMREDYGNPSSKHMLGVNSEKYLREARERIAKTLKCSEKEILFTSGGTESNNMALIGTAMANKRAGMHIITTCFEHPSVEKAADFLEEQGFEITRLKVDGSGHIDLEELKARLRPDTILVSIMFVNNEIGAVQDISAIGKAVKANNPKTVFHVDAVQAYGKYEINPARMNIDLLSVSAHKIHGPKGIGFLYIKNGTKIKPLILGGGQQKGMRSGTDNVPGAAGLGLAAENAYKDLAAGRDYLIGLKDTLTDGLTEMGVKVNSQKGELSAPHIVSATFAPVKSEVLLHALEDKGIYVSAGSACSSNKKTAAASDTLIAIGLDKKQADCTLRFSFSKYNTEEDVRETLKALQELLPVLSKFVSK